MQSLRTTKTATTSPAGSTKICSWKDWSTLFQLHNPALQEHYVGDSGENYASFFCETSPDQIEGIHTRRYKNDITPTRTFIIALRQNITEKNLFTTLMKTLTQQLILPKSVALHTSIRLTTSSKLPTLSSTDEHFRLSFP